MTTTTTPEATLAAWHADEARIRERISPVGVARPEQVAGKTGIQVFELMLGGQLPPPPMGLTLDFMLVEVEAGRAVFQGKPGPAHYNPMGTVHGGWYATLLDSCVGCAVHSALPAGKVYTTVELKINLVRALTAQVPLVRAEGKLIHFGRSMATAEGRLFGHDGKLYAHATTTCFIMDAPSPKQAPPTP